jgi:hypothetical protein
MHDIWFFQKCRAHIWSFSYVTWNQASYRFNFFLFSILLYFSGNREPLYSSHLLAKLNPNAKSGLIWSTTCTAKDPTKLSVKKWFWHDTLWKWALLKGLWLLYYNIRNNMVCRENNSTVCNTLFRSRDMHVPSFQPPIMK